MFSQVAEDKQLVDLNMISPRHEAHLMMHHVDLLICDNPSRT